MSNEKIVEIISSPRAKLQQLDALLDGLEDLNLRDIVEVPVRLGSALIDLGVENPYTQSVNDLIERVFELQEPILAAVRARPAIFRSIRTA